MGANPEIEPTSIDEKTLSQFSHIHLSAWKNMPQSEKDKIKIRPLCRNIGEVIALNGIIFLLKGFWSAFGDHWYVGAMIAWLVVAGFDVWYIGKSKRYQN